MTEKSSTAAVVERYAQAYAQELVAIRRDIHANPEPGREEFRTTRTIIERLAAAGLQASTLPVGTGALCDIDPSPTAADPAATTAAPTPLGRVALRADIDALPIADEKDVPYRSTRPGVCHACGHDVHTAIVLGAGLVLADLRDAGLLPHGVRLIFQPAEEVIPGGALDVIAAGGLDGVERIFALHCQPQLEVGQVGLRPGPLTSAADRIAVRLSGPGGHTARPHLTVDLVQALSTLAAQLPMVLARRVDPRSGLSIVWGRIHAGAAANAIPMEGELSGTMRTLDVDVWESAADLLPQVAREIVAPFGVRVEAEVHRGVPPVVNDPYATSLMQHGAEEILGTDAVTTTDQSLGGEDFAWYLAKVPGAMARLGVRPAGAQAYDIHQPTFDIDEHAIQVGVRFLVATALRGLS